MATSFTDLVRRLLAGDGGHRYWSETGRVSLGDAYDGFVERRLDRGRVSEARWPYPFRRIPMALDDPAALRQLD